jgi:LysR family transcriptional regulator for bpeEF and oprC
MHVSAIHPCASGTIGRLDRMPGKLDLAGLDLNELRVFGAVAARRSFVAAARALRIPTATVSRKVKSLEERLGVRLLQRTTRRVTPTDVGAALLERCQRIEDEVAEAEALVGSHRAAPRGTLHVTTPYTLGRELLAPLLPEFLARYPDLRVVLMLRNETDDLIARGVDVAVWPWPLRASNYATRLVLRGHPSFYASPAYLARRGRPATPQDLSSHDVLLYVGGEGAPRHEWTLRRGDRTLTVPVKPLLACNDFGPLRAAAAGGAGIILADAFMIRDRLRRKELVPVLPGWAGPPIDVRAVFPSRSGLAPKVRVFVEFLVERLGPPREDQR